MIFNIREHDGLILVRQGVIDKEKWMDALRAKLPVAFFHFITSKSFHLKGI